MATISCYIMTYFPPEYIYNIHNANVTERASINFIQSVKRECANLKI